MRNISSHCIIYSLDFPRLSSYFLSGLRSYLDTVSTFSKTYNSCSTSVTRCFRFRTHTVLPRLALWWLYFYLSNGGRKKATGWSCYLDTFLNIFRWGILYAMFIKHIWTETGLSSHLLMAVLQFA